MSERELRTRKAHKCDSCGKDIPAGSIALLGEFKGPRYDQGDNQIGIEYTRYYICLRCITEGNPDD